MSQTSSIEKPCLPYIAFILCHAAISDLGTYLTIPVIPFLDDFRPGFQAEPYAATILGDNAVVGQIESNWFHC
jgi:hypothetical protein